MKVKRFLAVAVFSMLISLYILISMPRKLFFVSLASFTLFAIFHRFTVNKHTAALILSILSAVFALAFLTGYNHIMHTRMDGLVASD